MMGSFNITAGFNYTDEYNDPNSEQSKQLTKTVKDAVSVPPLIIFNIDNYFSRYLT